MNLLTGASLLALAKSIYYGFSCSCIVEIVIILEGNEKEMRNTFKVFNRLNAMVQCICSLFQV